MFWSKNNVFKGQSKKSLELLKFDIDALLKIKDINIDFDEAFDYFCKNPNEFDGATIVKDLVDLPKLSIAAMVHDYQYLVKLSTRKGLWWLSYKIIVDWEYGQNLEKLGKGYFIPYLRAIILILTTPIYLIIKWIF